MQLYQLHQLRMPHWPSMAFGQGSQKEQLIKKIGKHKSARFLSLKQVVRSKAGATAQLILLWIVTKWRPDIMMKKSSCDIFSNVTKWQHWLQSTDEIVEILYSCFTKWASSVHEQACTHLVHTYHPPKSWFYLYVQVMKSLWWNCQEQHCWLHRATRKKREL